jgi:hypothetical protein
MRRALDLMVCALVWLQAPAEAAPPAESAQKWEARVLAALEAGDQKALRALVAEFCKLAPEVRRDLSLRVQQDSVEFAFRGEFPGDQTPWGLLEYLVSAPGKDYESLLVVGAAESKRVQALKPVFDKRAGEGRRKWWSARLVWTEGEKPNSVDLTDLLTLLEPKERDRFLDELSIVEAGLGGTINVNADAASLPRKRVPAVLLLTLRVTPKE